MGFVALDQTSVLQIRRIRRDNFSYFTTTKICCDPCYGSDEGSQYSDSFDEGLQHSEHSSMLLVKMKKNDLKIILKIPPYLEL